MAYWTWGTQPNTYYSEGSFPSYGWIGQHGEFQVPSGMPQGTDLQSMMMAQGLSEGGGGFDPSQPQGAMPATPLQYQSLSDITNTAKTATDTSFGGLSVLGTPGYNWMPTSSRANQYGLVGVSGVGGDPNARSIISDLKNAGLTDAQIYQYGALAQQSLPALTGNPRDPAAAAQNKDWAMNYMTVLNQVAKDNPQLAQRLAQNITPALQQSSRAYAGSMGAQSAEAAQGSKFDSFMGQWGWMLPIAGAAAAAGAAALGAGAAAGAGGGAAAGAGAGAGAMTAADAAEAAALTGSGVGGLAGGAALPGGITLGEAAGSGTLATLGADQLGNAPELGSGGFLNVSAPEAASSTNIGAAFPSDFVSSASAGGVPTASDVGTSLASFQPNFFVASPETQGMLSGLGGDWAASGSGNLLDTVKNAYDAYSKGQKVVNALSGNNTMTTQQQSPTDAFGNVFNSLISAYGSNKAAGQESALMQQLINSDLWRGQQPSYFAPTLAAATGGLGNTAYGQSLLDSVMKADAARGITHSGNFSTDALRALNTGTVQYLNAMTPLAMGHSPYAMGQTLGTIGQQQIGQNVQTQGNLGVAGGTLLSNLPGVVSGAKSLYDTISSLF